jgi:cardiolipin synthase
MLERDFAQACEVTYHEYRDAPALRRIVMHVARLFSPIL